LFFDQATRLPTPATAPTPTNVHPNHRWLDSGGAGGTDGPDGKTTGFVATATGDAGSPDREGPAASATFFLIRIETFSFATNFAA
jgi:hypothetical protein